MSQKTILGEELIPALDRMKLVLGELTPLQQQQVLELLMVNYLYCSSHRHKEHRLLMDGFNKHVWQLLYQAMGPRPPQ